MQLLATLMTTLPMAPNIRVINFLCPVIPKAVDFLSVDLFSTAGSLNLHLFLGRKFINTLSLGFDLFENHPT